MSSPRSDAKPLLVAGADTLIVAATLALTVGCAQPSPSTSGSVPPMSPANPGQAKDPPSMQTNQPLRFVVSFPPTVRSNPVSARVLLFVSRKPGGEPRQTSSFSSDPPQLNAI